MSGNMMKGEVISKTGQVLNSFYPKVSVDLSQGWDAPDAVALHTTSATLPAVVSSGSIVIIQPIKDGWGTSPDKENLVGYTEVPYRQAFILSYSSLTPAQPPVVNPPSGGESFYIDGYTLGGDGTESSPLYVKQDTSNYFVLVEDDDGNEISTLGYRNDKVLITADPVWFDGTTIGSRDGTVENISDIRSLGSTVNAGSAIYIAPVFSVPVSQLFQEVAG